MFAYMHDGDFVWLCGRRKIKIWWYEGMAVTGCVCECR